MGEEESKELEAFLTEAAKTFNQWVITNPTQLPLRAIDKGLISWIAALPIEQFETILSQVLTVFARFWWLRDMGKKLEPPIGLVPIYILIRRRLGYELMTNNKSWNPKTVLDVLIVREGNLLKKFPQTRQLVEKALNDLSAFAANIYNDYLEKKGLTGKKIYPNHYQEEILSVLGEAVMKKFTSRTDRDRILADKVRDLFRAVKGAKDLSFIPHRVALDKITEFHETKLGKQSLDLPVVTDSGLTLKDKLEDSFDPEELIERLDHQKIIAQALSLIDNPAILTDRERQVISMRYLQKKDEVVSLEEIGEELGISRQTAKETEARALKKLSPHLKHLKP